MHSLKDLPSGPAAGIGLAAVPARDDPRDALVARDGAKLADLPPGASDRHRLAAPGRPAARCSAADLRCVPIRGNAGTRLGKVTDGELDAVVLAYAGLARIGRLDAVTQVFEPDEMLPAPGQGALAVECRDGEPELAALLAAVADPASRAAVDRGARPAGRRSRPAAARRSARTLRGTEHTAGLRPLSRPRREPGAARARYRGRPPTAGSSAATSRRSCCEPGPQISSACRRHRLSSRKSSGCAVSGSQESWAGSRWSAAGRATRGC